MQKELKNVIKAIDEWGKENNQNVAFHASFISFNKNNNVIDATMFAFGEKKALIINSEKMIKEIKKEKKDFINW